jgi:DNA-binding FrmR family transcriptional regulator
MGYFGRTEKMSHTIEDKQKLLNRIRRLRGQIDALERAVDSETGCTEVMRQLTTARGAINGIMAEVVADHIGMHMVDENRKATRSETAAANELIEVLKSYIK